LIFITDPFRQKTRQLFKPQHDWSMVRRFLKCARPFVDFTAFQSLD
jgi:hypothetical protein